MSQFFLQKHCQNRKQRIFDLSFSFIYFKRESFMKSLNTFLLALVAMFVVSTAAVAAPADAKRVTVVFVVADDDDDDDQATVTTMYTTLMAAEKVANLLNVELTVSNESVSDDVFVFALKSEEQKNLAMKLLDEEGAEVGENLFNVEQGSNYRTINVANLKDGTYTFRLFDANGAETSEEFKVERGQRIK